MTSRLLVRRQFAKAAFLIAISVMLLSCETLGYYSQAARGQLSILFSREPIARLLSDEALDSTLRTKLELVMDIRSFAETELALPVGDNYGSYVDVGRDHVVWNVFAAPEFSTSPINWCYPIAGCVSYRGYFSESAALNFADEAEADGLDVYTGGVDAYSTLGWFEDPLLSTVISRRDYQLAALIFHELAHQVVYLPGNTAFNEGFATAVEREGLKRWLAAHRDQESFARAQLDRARQTQFVALVTDYQQRFDTLYQTDKSAQDMRSAKGELQSNLRAEYEKLKLSWGDYNGYDGWFSESLNNAQLSTVSAYNDLVPFFDAELMNADGDMAAFYNRVDELSKLDSEALDRLIEAVDGNL